MAKKSGKKKKTTAKGKSPNYAGGLNKARMAGRNKGGSSSLNPALSGARSVSDPGRAPRRGGGGGGGGSSGKGGSGSGKGKGGAGGGGSIGAAFNTKSEEAIRNITVKALKKGRHEVVSNLERGRENLKNQYGKGISAIKEGVTQGRGDITSSVNKAVGGVKEAATTAKGDVTKYNALGRTELRRGETTGRGDISTGARKGEGAIKTGLATSKAALGAGHTAARGDITGARDKSLGYFDPYSKAGAAGSQSYADALGLNGPEGVARAQAQFKVGPGYNFALEQGLTGIDRRASSRGELGGGGNDIDTINYAQGLANQEWQGYLSRLQGEQELGATTAGSMAGITGGAGTELAGIDTGYGKDVADLETGAGTAIANIAGQEGSNLANISTKTAGDIAANESATGTSIANIGTNAATTAGGYQTAGGEKMADIGETGSGRLLNTYGTLGNQAYDYATDLANIKYNTTTGIAAARSAFQNAKDATSANIWGTVLGVGNTAATLAAGRLPTNPTTNTGLQPQQGNLAVVR